MANSKNNAVTQADFENFKNEIKATTLEITQAVHNLEHILNKRTNYLIWLIGVLIVGGFSIGIFFIYDKLSLIDDKFTERVAFMNDQYSDRFSRIEAGVSISTPEVLALIDQLRKTSITKKNKKSKQSIKTKRKR